MTINEFYEIGEIRRKSEIFLRKMDDAVNTCKTQIESHKFPYVALSGGKDSGVLAYIVNEAAKETGKDYRIWSHISDASFPGTVETVKKIAESLGREVDFYESEYSAVETLKDHPGKRKFGKSGVFYDSVREYAEDKDLAFVGVRAAESKRRRKAARIKGMVFHSKSMGDVDVCYPMLWFRMEDVAAATVAYNIPLHPIYQKQSIDMGKNANGEDYFIRLGYITSRDLLDKGTAVFLKLNYPDIFAKLQRAYPNIRNNL